MVKDTAVPAAATVDLKLEVVVIPVADVDRSRRFYEGPGVAAGHRLRQRSGLPRRPDDAPWFAVLHSLRQGHHDGRAGLDPEPVPRGLRHGGGSRRAHPAWRRRERAVSLPQPRGRATAGPPPEGRSYSTHATFSDPDGNSWLLQEITTRLPGRGFSNLDVATLTDLLKDAEQGHGQYEPTAPKHHWSDWYAVVTRRARRGQDGGRGVVGWLEARRRHPSVRLR